MSDKPRIALLCPKGHEMLRKTKRGGIEVLSCNQGSHHYEIPLPLDLEYRKIPRDLAPFLPGFEIEEK
jgi:hypothetical protein